jgi:tetraacyldisaccharide 4'-kinase
LKESAGSQDWFLSVVSGRREGALAWIARGAFSAAEPIYTGVVHARNFIYTRKMIIAAHARRPVVSIGNVTTGGTGKTPLVAWMVGQLRASGRTPAVLLRGYRSSGGVSDEELLLRDLIAPSSVLARPNRLAASEQLLVDHPEIDAFVLDDGLQHRQLARHINLALVDATSPFGFDHVLPRGLMREPMRAYRRVHAVIVTRADLVDSATLEAIEERIRAEQRDVPIFRCNLVQDRLLDSAGAAQPIESIRGQRVFAFCGIGNPDAFLRQIQDNGAELAGTHRFTDHHPYTENELNECVSKAKADSASMVLTTEKDWVKIAPLLTRLSNQPPILRIGVSVQFHGDGGERLMGMVMNAIREGDQRLGWKDASVKPA